MNVINKNHLTLAALLCATLPGLSASERQLSYTHGSEVLAPGQREFEFWGTSRAGRAYYYRRFDSRLELEYGLADNLQTAIYLNFTSTTSDPSGTGSVEKESVSGASWELKWKLADPVADAVGVALYVEPEYSGDEAAIEFKGILDKRFGDNLFALNLTAEPEWEFEPDASKPEFKTEVNLGWSHRFTPRLAAGLELRSVSVVEYEDTAEESEWELEHSEIYGGPTLHLTGDGIWGTFTVMPQLLATKTASGNPSSRREQLHAERLEVRALIGLDF